MGLISLLYGTCIIIGFMSNSIDVLNNIVYYTKLQMYFMVPVHYDRFGQCAVLVS